MKKYVFKPYSKLFPKLFEAEKKRLFSLIPRDVQIEHVGSTAVEGLGGKGIIDIAIAGQKPQMQMISEQLQTLGYELRLSFSTEDRLYFVAFLPDPEETTRRYHIHLTHPESKDWKDLLGFREALRRHPSLVQEYAELKKQAAALANQEGKIYRKHKGLIFEKALHFPLKKIAIMGLPGSGKSTFALKLSKHLGLPLFHLDKYFFVENWKERDAEEFLQMQEKLVQQEAWIIDGNALQSLETRFSRADAVLYFRLPRFLCLWRIFKRLLSKDPHISDRAEGCRERVRFRLIRYLWEFDRRVRPLLDKLRKKYPAVHFVEGKSDQQVEAWLQHQALSKNNRKEASKSLSLQR